MSQKTGKSPKAPEKSQALSLKGKDLPKIEDLNLESLLKTPPALLKRINALKNEQLKLIDLESNFFEEMHALECKYAKLYDPIYEKRRQIISGEYEPNEEEGKWKLDELNEEGDGEVKKEAEETKEETKKEEEKGIPHFWLETLQSLKITSELIHEHDEPILNYLKDIRVKLFDQKPYGYVLEFYFDENPYFSNTVLTKTYELKIEVDNKDPFSFEGPDLDKSTGCKIDWKPNKNVTVKLTKKKIKSKNKKAPPKIITKEEKQDSFFNFFDTVKSEKSSALPSKQVANRTSESDGFDDDEDEDLYMFADFEIGQYIREKVIPKAVLYYTGELDDMDDEYDYDEDEDDEDDEDGDENEDEDEEDDDDDDDDDDDHGKKGGKGGAKKQLIHQGKQGGHHKHNRPSGEPTPSECKQN